MATSATRQPPCTIKQAPRLPPSRRSVTDKRLVNSLHSVSSEQSRPAENASTSTRDCPALLLGSSESAVTVSGRHPDPENSGDSNTGTSTPHSSEVRRAPRRSPWEFAARSEGGAANCRAPPGARQLERDVPVGFPRRSAPSQAGQLSAPCLEDGRDVELQSSSSLLPREGSSLFICQETRRTPPQQHRAVARARTLSPGVAEMSLLVPQLSRSLSPSRRKGLEASCGHADLAEVADSALQKSERLLQEMASLGLLDDRGDSHVPEGASVASNLAKGEQLQRCERSEACESADAASDGGHGAGLGAESPWSRTDSFPVLEPQPSAQELLLWLTSWEDMFGPRKATVADSPADVIGDLCRRMRALEATVADSPADVIGDLCRRMRALEALVHDSVCGAKATSSSCSTPTAFSSAASSSLDASFRSSFSCASPTFGQLKASAARSPSQQAQSLPETRRLQRRAPVPVTVETVTQHCPRRSLPANLQSVAPLRSVYPLATPLPRATPTASTTPVNVPAPVLLQSRTDTRLGDVTPSIVAAQPRVTKLVAPALSGLRPAQQGNARYVLQSWLLTRAANVHNRD
eukprot:TRINITY_DN32701_c0_g1_i1.p1 TRINITY_DN32701_c0_g1~~TRINITY_DN32701_c0_g1_i1.p1  ORF type:complete len:597 (+),score=60.07 TRINITY_DN32701_c0_g1_i1:57-1793(+)